MEDNYYASGVLQWSTIEAHQAWNVIFWDIQNGAFLQNLVYSLMVNAIKQNQNSKLKNYKGAFIYDVRFLGR